MAKNQITIPVFIPHQGCPHRCIFCNQWKTSSTSSFPKREPVIDRIDSYLESKPPTVERVELAFFGGSFTGLSNERQVELLSIAKVYREKNRIHGIRLSTRPDYIDHEGVALLKAHGVTTVELGIQSFSDPVLRSAERGHTSLDSERAVRLLKEQGLATVIQLMPGLPGDTAESALKSARKAADLEPDGMRIYPAVVLNGTEMEKRFLEGWYEPFTLEEAVAVCAEILRVCRSANIPVIRTGLHPFSPDEEKSIVAGPYHPAFGFIVKSRLRRDEMEEAILSSGFQGSTPGSKILTLAVPARNLEEYYGTRRENIHYLREKFALDRIHLVHDSTRSYPVVMDTATVSSIPYR